MNKKKVLVWVMLCIMMIQSIPMQLLAATQSVISEVEIPSVTHTLDKTGSLRPSVDLLWKEPSSNDADQYRIELEEYITKSQGKVYTTDYKAKDTIDNAGTKKVQKLQELRFKEDSSYKLKNGAYYRVGVRGMHSHRIEQGDGKPPTYTTHESPSIVPIYFITDFDTTVTPVNQGLTVEWEYIPGANYRLVIAPGDGTIKEQIDNNALKEVQIITDNQVIEQDLINNQNRISYTVTGLKAMESYAVYVEVDGFSTNPAGQNIKPIKNEYIDERGPKVVRAMPEITLEITDVGQSKIEIYWGKVVWAEATQRLTGVRVYAITDGKKELVAEKNKLIGDLESIVIDKPSKPTYYEVVFLIDNYEEVTSRPELYTPSELLIKPLNPKVPKPYSSNLIITGNREDYLVSDDQITTGNAQFIEHTFHAKVEDDVQIQLVWDAPKKQNVEEKNQVDYGLIYDIWVSDDFKLLQDTNKIEPIKANLSIGEGAKENLITQVGDIENVIGMKALLAEYLTQSAETKELIKKKITTNNVYYIKIVAKRHLVENEYIESEPTIVSIKLDEQGNIAVPPVMGKPPLRIKEKDGVTTTSITVEWLTRWQEILTKDSALPLYAEDADEAELAKLGHTKVYLPIDGKIVERPFIRFKAQPGFKGVSAYTKEQIEGKNGVKEKVDGLGQQQSPPIMNAFTTDYYTRQMILEDDIEYEIKVLPYTQVESELGKEQSIENWIITTQKDSTEGWNKIEPQEGTKESQELIWKEYKVDNLTANTRYVIMLRAYRIIESGDKLIQSFPSYIIGTTLTDYEPPEAKPTVPTLELKSYTDTEVTVQWTYNKEFDYELVYSTKDNPDQAQKWEFTISDDPLDKNYVADGKKASVTIAGLFPQTNYNIWIKAKQKKGTDESEWSNPVNVTTKELQAPSIPTGLGPAATQSLLDLNLDFKPIGSDYITVEWNKDIDDLGKQTEGKIEKSYEYDLEFADNVEFLDSKVVVVQDTLGSGNNYEVLAKSIVKFNKLIANRPYYVRIKARVILTDTESKRTISKESEYSTWVRIFTKTSSGEYDGGENDNIVTYPDAIVESFKDGEWTLEIVDAQKIIGDIKASKDYFYTITMKKYNNRYEAHLRRIKIPVSVMQALATSRMELKIETEIGIYEIPAQAMSYYIDKANAKDMVQLELETLLAYDLRNIAMPFPYSIDKAEKLSVKLQSKVLTKAPLERFDSRVKVALKLDTANMYQTQTLKTYTYDYSYGGWLANEHKIDTRVDATYAVYSTASTGIYTLQRIINYTDYRHTNAAMDQLLSRYNIEALGNKYGKNTSVNSDQMINLILGIAQGYTDINMDADVVQNRKKASAANIYTEARPGTVTQEQALHAVVRLYEMTSGNRVKASSVSVRGVSQVYKEGVQKAYALGIVNDVAPQQTVTYGELAELIVMVLP